MALTRRGIKKQFYSIGDVCDLLGLKPHVLRYWETQFSALEPTKNRAGNRVYRDRDIERIALIRRLLHEEKYTVEGARQWLGRLDGEGEVDVRSEQALHGAQLDYVRRELARVLDLLDPKSV